MFEKFGNVGRLGAALMLVALVSCSGGEEPEPTEWLVVEIDAGTTEEDASVDAPDEGTITPPDMAPVPQPDGAACEADADCAGGTCLTGPLYPDGYCTVADCGGGCADGSVCSTRNETQDFCAPLCESDVDCRDGYACTREGGRGQATQWMCKPITGAADGEACESRDDCQGGFCLDWAGGHCTTFRCENDGQCANLGGSNNICLQDGSGFSLCVRECTDNAECREGYVCGDVGLGTSVCLEDPARPFDDVVFQPSALDIQCGIEVADDGTATIAYEVADTTTSYMITPMARDGQPIEPRRIVLPDSTQKNFNSTRAFLGVPATFFGSMNPTLVPPAPGFEDMLAAGTNEYVVGADGEEICYYVLEKQQPGNQIDLNVYLVDVPNVTAATAGGDPNFTAVFDEVRQIYGQVGLELGVIRFHDISGENATRFGVLQSDAEVQELVKLSTPPGDDLASLLSVNVFFVGEFAMRGVIGISSGLPGPAGLHGTHGSGVVFTAEYMGGPVDDALGTTIDGNAYTALLLAHEVGHWLGLFHTSEQGGFGHDPLDDTPECSDPNNATACGDWGNLMFPFAAAGNTVVTPNQGSVLLANPATYFVGGTP